MKHVKVCTFIVLLCGLNVASVIDASESYCQVAGPMCLSFDGHDIVTLGNHASLQLSGDLAVTTWVKLSPGTTGQYMGIVGKMNGARGFVLVRHENNRFRFWIGDGFGYTGLDSNQIYTDSEWHHLAGVVNEGASKIYVDGVLHATGGANLVVADSGQFAYVGRQYSGYDGRYFKGQVDDVRFYDYSLTDLQVAAALSSAPNPDPGLKGYWTFDEGQGQITQDVSGHGNHGTLGSSSSVDSSDPTWTETGCDTAATYYVDAIRGANTNSGLSEQTPFNTIQHAIDASDHGDTVVVLPGLYVGVGNINLDYGGRLITVRSSDGPAHTIIDCQGLGRGIVFQSGEDPTAVFEGFTITHGNADRGGAVYCNGSSPTIKGCDIVANVGHSGGGIYCHDNAHAVITGCRLLNNTGTYNGGIRVVRSDVRVTHCVIAHNSSTEGGAGIRCDYGPGRPEFTHCTIANNISAGYGGGFWAGFGAQPTLSHCLVWGNASGQQGQDMAVSSESIVTVTFSDVLGGRTAIYPVGDGQVVWGQGNVDVDPLFVGPEVSDYHLQSQRGRYSREHDLWVLDSETSPCIDAGDPLAHAADEPDSMRLNLGAYGGTAFASMFPHEGIPEIRGDVDGNGSIEMLDLYILIEQWLNRFGMSL